MIEDKLNEARADYLNCTDQISLACRPAFSNSKYNLFIACGRSVNVYNSNSGQCIGKLKGPKFEVISICISKTNEIYACDEQNNIYVWKTKSKEVETYALVKPKYISPMATVCFFQLGYDSSLFVGFKSQTNAATLFLYKNIKSTGIFLADLLLSRTNTIAVSKTSLTVAALRNHALVITKVSNLGKNLDTRIHMSSKRLVCVAYNSKADPRHDIVAVGDITGAIVLYYNMMKQYPIKSILHWHTLPVQDLVFTMEGKDSELLSGGSENVIVCWRYSEDLKRFLPRMGMPIKFLAVNSSNLSIAALHEDRGVSLVDKVSYQLRGLIQSLVHHVPSKDIPPVPVGLVFNPQNSSLVLNGRSGYLQVLDPYTSKLMYNVDISMSNLLSAERTGSLPNPEVTRVQFSSDGKWMVTAELCYLNAKLTETFLKFWEFMDVNQGWQLNTVINMAHDDVITSIALNPGVLSSCVTSSNDATFKLWILYERPAVGMKTKSTTFWSSSLTRSYHNLLAVAASYSPDASLLAVAFKHVITFWTPDEHCKYIRCLSQSFLTQHIREFFFSRGEREGSSLVTRTDDWLCCWDLLSCALRWSINIASTCIAVENNSGVMVLFASNNSMYFFEPHSSNPLKVVPNVRCKNILSATFVPSSEAFMSDLNVPWKTNSVLYFMDTDQNLMNIKTLDDFESGTMMNSATDSLDEIFSENKAEKSFYSTLVAESKQVVNEKPVADFQIAKDNKFIIQKLEEFTIHGKKPFSSILKDHLSYIVPNIGSTDAAISNSVSYTTNQKEEIESNIATSHEKPISIKALRGLCYQKMVSQLKL